MKGSGTSGCNTDGVQLAPCPSAQIWATQHLAQCSRVALTPTMKTPQRPGNYRCFLRGIGKNSPPTPFRAQAPLSMEFPLRGATDMPDAQRAPQATNPGASESAVIPKNSPACHATRCTVQYPGIPDPRNPGGSNSSNHQLLWPNGHLSRLTATCWKCSPLSTGKARHSRPVS